MKRAAACLTAALAIVISLACSRLPGPKDLDPESREFLSKVRYIITKEEREAFARVAPSDRLTFIREFWKRRDPTPGTEENEFKDGYYRRIEEANRLFKEGSTEGWLQERGRIYITLGPPDNRETYPRGVDMYGKPEEIWWYGNYPVVFIDENWSGNYRLTPLGAQHIAEINQAQAIRRAQGAGYPGDAPPASVAYDLTVETVDGKSFVVISIPYKAIWLKSEGDLFKTTLEVALTVSGADGQKVWDTKNVYEISLSQAEQMERQEQRYEIRIETDLSAGEYRLDAEVSNQTGGGRSKRSFKVKIG
jgi:GWxTD domain-containing protein